MTIAIYACEERPSREERLDDQVWFCKQFARAKKLKVSKKYIFADLGFVSTLEKPSALCNLMAACRTGEIKAVIFEDFHFLADDIELLNNVTDELERLNVILLPVKSFPEHDPYLLQYPEEREEEVDEEFVCSLRAKVRELGGVA